MSRRFPCCGWRGKRERRAERRRVCSTPRTRWRSPHSSRDGSRFSASPRSSPMRLQAPTARRHATSTISSRSTAAHVQHIRRALEVEDFATARSLYPELQEEVAAARLNPAARRAANRALRDVEEGTSEDAYWRQPTWKRLAVIGAGPAMNILVAFIIFVIVYSTGAPSSRAST